MQRIAYMLIGLASLLSGLALHARNQAPVTLDFYTGTFTLPLSLLLVLAVLVGVLLGGLAMLPGRWRQARRIRRLERDLLRQAKPLSNASPPADSSHGA